MFLAFAPTFVPARPPTATPQERTNSKMVIPPPRSGSVASARSRMSLDGMSRETSRTSVSRMSVGQSMDILSREVSVHKPAPTRPLGWKPRQIVRPTVGQVARDANLKKFDGAARRAVEWDGLRKDPDLWFPDGDCLVHLYGRGQSRRGPAFKVPFKKLITSRCQPLLNRFLVTNFSESPGSDSSRSDAGGYFKESSAQYELYIPAPFNIERGQAMNYHIATRNFFAWVFGRSLVGSQLGTSLVGLLNSMTEFRSGDADNVQDILDFMDEEGYADLRSVPNHALAVLHFAEHYHFNDLYLDAFVHCVGMTDILDESSEFDFISKESRALIRRARTEMDTRLSRVGKSLSTFLEDELSPSQIRLAPGARTHLDRFRSFLQAYYVAKLGYYPPTSPAGRANIFPKEVSAMMNTDLQMLFDYLVDEEWSMSENAPPAQDGINLLELIMAFDERHRYITLDHALPVLPDASADVPVRSRSRLSFLHRGDKMKLDPKLTALSAMTKATNRKHIHLLDNSLVRAYRDFEKECIFSTSRSDRSQHVSASDARKVRWLLIYGMSQTLRSIAKVPSEVRDTENVKYDLCVSTAGCPPFEADKPYHTLLRTQTEFTKNEDVPVNSYTSCPGTPVQEISSMPGRSASAIGMASETRTIGGNIRRALSSLGNMPELIHPRPQRASFSEILVSGYGNGSSTVTITASPTPAPTLAINTDITQIHKRHMSEAEASDSGISSRWSQSSDGGETSASSVSESPLTPGIRDRRGSIISLGKNSIRELLSQPVASFTRQANGRHGDIKQTIQSDESLKPEPLSVRKSIVSDAGVMRVTKEVKVHYESVEDLRKFNPELDAYLAA